MNDSTPSINKKTFSQRFSIEGIELSSLKRYMIALSVLILCLLLLLWSRIQLGKPRMKLGKAQQSYEVALKEHQRLELELNYILSPASIDQQIQKHDLDPNVPVIDVTPKPQ